jgi:hypothetical protein
VDNAASAVATIAVTPDVASRTVDARVPARVDNTASAANSGSTTRTSQIT